MAEEKHEIIIGYESECSLCGHKSFGKTKEESHKTHVKHIDNECKFAKIIRYVSKEFPGATMADVVWFVTGKKIKGRNVFKDM